MTSVTVLHFLHHRLTLTQFFSCIFHLASKRVVAANILRVLHIYHFFQVVSFVKTSPPQSCHANLHAENISHAEPRERHLPVVFRDLPCFIQHSMLDL